MKKVLCMVLAMGFAILATGCGGTDVSIEDTNGYTNFNLTQITDENIINQDIGASKVNQTPPAGETDLTTLTEFQSDNYSGVTEIYSAHMDGTSGLIIDVSLLEVYDGNFRLCVVHDGEIVYDFTLNEMYESCEFGVIEGDVSVVMAGESANFLLNIEIW